MIIRRKSKKIIYGTVCLLLLLLCGFYLQHTLTSRAVTGSDWQAGLIIADDLFYDNSSMSVGDIQNFLNSKVSACDTNGTQPASEYGRSDITHAQYAALAGWPGPPYVCLKDYYQVPRSDTIINNYSGSIPSGAISAAQIIKNASDTYKVSPKALLVLLQKESLGPLPIDKWPLEKQYKNAMGFGCPDTAPCDAQYAGFYNQVMNAAKRFQSYKQYPNSYRHIPYANNNVYYNPNLSGCGSSTVYIRSYATAGLYNYTPYQPNQAALNNLYGSGDGCSAYGNRNFWRIYNDWFGPTSPSPYSWSIESQKMYTDQSMSTEIPYNSTINQGQKVYIVIKARNTGTQTWDRSFMRLATENPRDRSSPFYDTSWISQNRISAMQESSVSPGSTGTFAATLQAPTDQNSYQEYYGLVAEDRAWLNNHGLYYPITVKYLNSYDAKTTSFTTYSDSARAVQLSSGTSVSTKPGSSLYVRARIKNVGSTTWTNTTATIATSNPLDRNSPFYDTSWISQNRITRANEAQVKPGEVGTFDFTIKSPSSEQSYSETYGLVIDGVQWVSQNIGQLSIAVKSKPPSQLLPGESLRSNTTQDRIMSPSGAYAAVIQNDGNFVVWSLARPIWATGTVGTGGYAFFTQGDNNLVLWSSSRPVWASNTVRSGGSTLFMQDDGNLVLWSSSRPVWASNTANVR